MKLLFKRSQSAYFGRPAFKLWARIALERDEEQVMRKYGFFDSVMIHVDQPGLVRNSFLIGLLTFCIAVPVYAYNFFYEIGLGWPGVYTVATVTALLAGFIFYHQMRETIYVKDLYHGRYFKCRSVVDLARKEAWLEGVTAYLRQVMESAKHWGGEEVREIPALPKDEALKVIIRG